MVIDHFQNPRNQGKLDAKNPNVGTGISGSPACGDMMRLQVEVDENNIVVKAKFMAFGCGSALASGSYATEILIGKTLDECMKLTNQQISSDLCLPPVKGHCSLLAEETIKGAIQDVKAKKAKVRVAA
jgi:nitrogen fixation NifU-like protein